MASADVLPAASSWEGLKKEADTAFGKGHYTQAVTYYGQAIELASRNKTDEPARAKLFANRALTYQRAGEHTYPLLSALSSLRIPRRATSLSPSLILLRMLTTRGTIF